MNYLLIFVIIIIICCIIFVSNKHNTPSKHQPKTDVTPQINVITTDKLPEKNIHKQANTGSDVLVFELANNTSIITEEDFRQIPKSSNPRNGYARTKASYSTSVPNDKYRAISSGMYGLMFSLRMKGKLKKEGILYIDLPEQIAETFNKYGKSTEDFNKNLEMTASLNNKGISLEKDGKIDEAKKVYEECVGNGSLGRHSYDRLLVFYRKEKDYKSELRIARLASIKFPSDQKYKDRITKISGLIAKQSITHE